MSDSSKHETFQPPGIVSQAVIIVTTIEFPDGQRQTQATSQGCDRFPDRDAEVWADGLLSLAKTICENADEIAAMAPPEANPPRGG